MVALLGIFLLAAAPAADAQRPPRTEVSERAADPRDKMICKRFLETGSLVRGYRTCKPKSEWDRERDNIRSPAPTSACSVRGDGAGC